MASITSSIDDALEAATYQRLPELGITPFNLIRQPLECVVETRKLPVRRVVLSRDDHDFLALVRKRLTSLQSQLPASLDDL